MPGDAFARGPSADGPFSTTLEGSPLIAEALEIEEALEQQGGALTGETIEAVLAEALAHAEQCLRLITSTKEMPGAFLTAIVGCLRGVFHQGWAEKYLPVWLRLIVLSASHTASGLKALEAMEIAKQLHASLAAMSGADVSPQVSSTHLTAC